MQSSKKSFLQLIRQGIGHHAYLLSCEIDWSSVKTLAALQGLSAIIIDGIDSMPPAQRPPKPILLQWIGETLQLYENRFEAYRRAIAEMAGFYNRHGFKMMVLKGYGCAMNWPKPEHRPCGDIDIWLFGKQEEADAVLAKEKGIKIDNAHHHHSVFYWREFMVENHYDFINVHTRKSSRELEKVFKELGADDSHYVEVHGEKVYVPSPNLHALFLMRHMASHFVGSNITLRQVLDWAFFVEKHTKVIDRAWLQGMLDRFHMREFYNCINAICVEDLGFSSEIFPAFQFLPSLKERVLGDILEPAFATEAPRGFVKRVIFKFRRWRGNAWKQELCYSESLWSAFWGGVGAKVLKPAGI